MKGSAANLRMVSIEPSKAIGGTTALTRLPSGSRASTMGLDSSTRRPTRADDLVDGAPEVRLVGEDPGAERDAALALEVDLRPVR